ncbi:putative RNA polymerase II-associated factor 1 [Blattamonas nauphoetae]|uniref:RNA polymerase II-associated factor 1 n=1 Tax=Blattamonas nauphoetae TaxID=2049346 RepID=A0ABQ9YMC7_9EUKA|nr:putative RNA polymerase II-associated factor 1 [Blattamonas nauphoetae]
MSLPSPITPINYRLTLPDVPADPILLSIKSDPSSFIEFTDTDFAKNSRWPLLSEPDLGVPIDLVKFIADTIIFDPAPIDPTTPSATLDPRDEILLPEEIDLKGIPEKGDLVMKNRRKGGQTQTFVKQNFFNDDQIFAPNRATITKEQEELEADQHEDILEMPRFADRYQELEETFTAFHDNDFESFKHPTKPHLTANKVSSLLPNTEGWGNIFSQIIFENDRSLPQDARMEHSLIFDEENNPNEYNLLLPVTNRPLDSYQDSGLVNEIDEELQKGDIETAASKRDQLYHARDYEGTLHNELVKGDHDEFQSVPHGEEDDEMNFPMNFRRQYKWFRGYRGTKDTTVLFPPLEDMAKPLFEDPEAMRGIVMEELQQDRPLINTELLGVYDPLPTLPLSLYPPTSQVLTDTFCFCYDDYDDNFVYLPITSRIRLNPIPRQERDKERGLFRRDPRRRDDRDYGRDEAIQEMMEKVITVAVRPMNEAEKNTAESYMQQLDVPNPDLYGIDGEGDGEVNEDEERHIDGGLDYDQDEYED